MLLNPEIRRAFLTECKARGLTGSKGLELAITEWTGFTRDEDVQLQARHSATRRQLAPELADLVKRFATYTRPDWAARLKVPAWTITSWLNGGNVPGKPEFDDAVTTMCDVVGFSREAAFVPYDRSADRTAGGRTKRRDGFHIEVES